MYVKRSSFGIHPLVGSRRGGAGAQAGDGRARHEQALQLTGL
jgi:hypothetical protein